LVSTVPKVFKYFNTRNRNNLDKRLSSYLKDYPTTFDLNIIWIYQRLSKDLSLPSHWKNKKKNGKKINSLCTYKGGKWAVTDANKNKYLLQFNHRKVAKGFKNSSFTSWSTTSWRLFSSLKKLFDLYFHKTMQMLQTPKYVISYLCYWKWMSQEATLNKWKKLSNVLTKVK